MNQLQILSFQHKFNCTTGEGRGRHIALSCCSGWCIVGFVVLYLSFVIYIIRFVLMCINLLHIYLLADNVGLLRYAVCLFIQLLFNVCFKLHSGQFSSAFDFW